MTIKTPIAILAAPLAILAFSSTPALAAAPEQPQTEAPTTVTATTAILHGVMNPNTAEKAHWLFAYSPEEDGPECVDAYRTSEREVEDRGVAESAEVTELEPHRKYTLCLIASNTEGETRGNEVSFETESLAPEVANQSALNVSSSEAQIVGTVNAKNEPTTCVIEYGTVSASEHETPCEPEAIEGDYPANVSASIQGLEANKTYHYSILASNATGGSEATGELLTLPNSPTAITESPSLVTAYSATISGSVNPNATGEPAQDDTTYYFQYGTNTSYGEQIPLTPTEIGEGTGPTQETTNLAGLEPGTTYHYRIVANNANNASAPQKPQVTYGEDKTFTTIATPPVLSEVTTQGITQTTATITAALDPQNLPTHYELQLGATPGQLQPTASGQTTSTTTLTISLGALTPATTYYYKLTATNPNDTETPTTTATAKGTFTTTPNPTTPQTASLPPIIPYQTITELNTREALEDKGLPTPHTTKPLTKTQKLAKALKTCRKDKNKHKRATCEKQAQHKYGTANSKRKR